MPAPDRPGIGSLVDRFRAEQEQANADLVPFVDEARLEELRDRLLAPRRRRARRGRGVDPELGAEPRAERRRTPRGGRVKARKVKQLDPRATLAENAARIVLVRVGELRSFAPEALDPDAVGGPARHADRREAAALRARGDRVLLRPAGDHALRRRAKEIQDLLGEVHDADVMLPRLHEHRRELRDEDAEQVRSRAGDADDLDPELAARAPHRTTYRGLEVLEVYLLARRALLFERFIALWEASEKRGVWRALERAAERELERSRGAARGRPSGPSAPAGALAEAERARREAEELARARRGRAGRRRARRRLSPLHQRVHRK